MSTTVRIADATRDLLKSLAQEEGQSMQVVMERALELYRRRRFLEQINAGYASDAKSGSVAAEDALWDRTLSDGLQSEGRPKRRR